VCVNASATFPNCHARPAIVTTSSLPHMHGAAFAQICLQIAYIFVPVASTISSLVETLLTYLSNAGYACTEMATAPSLPVRVPAAPGGPQSEPPAALADAAAAVLAPQHLACAWDASAAASAPLPAAGEDVTFDGKPYEYLSPWLPRAMFDHIACLVSIGVRMDEVAKSHGIERLRALDVVKHQVCSRSVHMLQNV
jgi:hypothetical protein